MQYVCQLHKTIKGYLRTTQNRVPMRKTKTVTAYLHIKDHAIKEPPTMHMIISTPHYSVNVSTAGLLTLLLLPFFPTTSELSLLVTLPTARDCRLCDDPCFSITGRSILLACRFMIDDSAFATRVSCTLLDRGDAQVGLLGASSR